MFFYFLACLVKKLAVSVYCGRINESEEIMVVGNSWDIILEQEFKKPYFDSLGRKVKEEYASYRVFPKKADIFNAFKYASFDNVKVVILGQDPYHEIGQAHGVSFSVQDGTQIPPSLKNIFKEIAQEYGTDMPKSGNLIKWAKQGVLLLNTVLTVREGQANSHASFGWQEFTDNIIKELNNKTTPIVFMLWGGNARRKKEFITNPIHLVLETSHPSPLSAYQGFLGCGHFLRANEFLRANGEKEIDFTL
ncbi:MAG: uracil-DNA glycosylase [Clostridia bacterium]